MKRFTKTTGFITLLAMLITGCTERNELDTPVDNFQQCIAISVTEEENPVVTRGTPLNSASEVTSLGLFCTYTEKKQFSIILRIYPNKMVNKKMYRLPGTDSWAYEGADVTWDNTTAADNYTFFAYAPYSTPENGISMPELYYIPNLRYKAPANVADQPDLMIAESRRDIHPTGHPIDLKMKHVLTAVGFTLQGNGQVVTGLSLTGVYSEGTINIDLANGNANTWRLAGDKTDTFNIPIAGGACTADATEQNLMANDGYLMMIQQPVTDSAKVTLTFANNQTKEIKLSGTGNLSSWEQGKKVTYKIIL